jgi:protein-disulfide isomerase/plastocyanin
MEQKQLDDEESFFGDEFIEEEVQISPVNEEKPKKKVAEKKAKIAKKAAKKTAPVEEKMVEPKVEIIKEDIKESKIEPVVEPVEEKKEESKVETTPTIDPWEENSDETQKGSSTWKLIAGILLVLLVASIYTDGFGLTGSAAAAELTIGEAEQKALDYVNTNLLQAPFVAEVSTSEDVGNLYQVTLFVAGQEVESYITKDGNLFFPQGFDVNDVIVAQEDVQFDVPVDDDAIKGDVNAPVTIIEFSDFECPFCGKYIMETYPQIVEDYIESGKVRYVFRDFPLSFHPNAQKAAEAAECAGEQGMYWEMHDYLFANQDYLEVENLKGYAKDLELDTEEFDECLDSGAMEEEVLADLLEGQSFGVSGTPGFFINGKMISGAQPYEVFVQEIEAALAEGEEVVVEEVPEEVEIEVLVEEEPVAEELEELIIEVPEEETIVEEVVEEPVAEEVEIGSVVEVAVDAKKWLFNPEDIKVSKGDRIKMTIVPIGLDFTFAIPSFGVSEEVSGTTIVEFTADQAGTFEFKCSSCEDWRGMTGELTIE